MRHFRVAVTPALKRSSLSYENAFFFSDMHVNFLADQTHRHVEVCAAGLVSKILGNGPLSL